MSVSTPVRSGPPGPNTPFLDSFDPEDLLTRSNLLTVHQRTMGLRRLVAFTTDPTFTPAQQAQTCGQIKNLPFLRLSKRLRKDRMHTRFVDAGRVFNRELLDAKLGAGERLEVITTDLAVKNDDRRFAAAVSVRCSSGLRVEWAELTDREIPAHLLTPKDEEPKGASTRVAASKEVKAALEAGGAAGAGATGTATAATASTLAGAANAGALAAAAGAPSAATQDDVDLFDSSEYAEAEALNARIDANMLLIDRMNTHTDRMASLPPGTVYPADMVSYYAELRKDAAAAGVELPPLPECKPIKANQSKKFNRFKCRKSKSR